MIAVLLEENAEEAGDFVFFGEGILGAALGRGRVGVGPVSGVFLFLFDAVHAGEEEAGLDAGEAEEAPLGL